MGECSRKWVESFVPRRAEWFYILFVCLGRPRKIFGWYIERELFPFHHLLLNCWETCCKNRVRTTKRINWSGSKDKEKVHVHQSFQIGNFSRNKTYHSDPLCYEEELLDKRRRELGVSGKVSGGTPFNYSNPSSTVTDEVTVGE